MSQSPTPPGPGHRCPWCGSDPLYTAYHDTEWGVAERDPRALWEKLILDGFQAGLSWITILRKRDAFREEFDGFDPARVALWDAARIAKALGNPGIVRHRGKIEGAVRSAQAYLQIPDFSDFCWRHVGGVPIVNRPATMAEVPTETEASRALSKALRKAGFTFCGPTITYAFMQACGLVDDHLATCPRARKAP
jgi:DNA-3-methyladenine glycosylase I